jgi:hypothetical protein
VKKEIKIQGNKKIVLFLFKVISAYLNTFVAPFKKFLKTVSKGLRKNSVQFGRPVFLNVLNILKPRSFEGSFHRRKEKKIRWCEIRRIGSVTYLHNAVFGQKYLHYQCRLGGALSYKNQLLSARNCGLTREMRFNNLPITSTQKALSTVCPSGTNCL